MTWFDASAPLFPEITDLRRRRPGCKATAPSAVIEDTLLRMTDGGILGRGLRPADTGRLDNGDAA